MNSQVVEQVELCRAKKSARSHALMHFLMLLATTFWAANIVAGKEALRAYGSVSLAELRVLGAAIIFGMLFISWRKRPALRLNARSWGVFLLIGLVGIAINQNLFLGGLARASVAHTGLIVALGPVMVLVLSCLMRLEALTVPKFVGMLISFAGVAFLTLGKGGRVNGGLWMGDLLLLAASATAAYYTILAKEVIDRYDTITLNTVTFGLAALFLIPFSTRAVLSVRWAALPAPAWWALAYVVVLGTVVPYLVQAYALSELSASRVAAFGYLQPVIATALGAWLLREKLTRSVGIGGTLILLGVYLTERERGEEIGNRGQGTGDREQGTECRGQGMETLRPVTCALSPVTWLCP